MADEENVHPSISQLNVKDYKYMLDDVTAGVPDNRFLPMGEDSQDLDQFAADMHVFRQQYPHQYPTTSQVEMPSSSSPQPAYPHNIPYSPGPVQSHRNNSISPVNTHHYDTNSSYSEASTPMTPSPGIPPYTSHLPTIPSTTEYPGDYNFQVSFGPITEYASKSATWTYSEPCKKLYVNLASYCPIKFKTAMPPPPGTYMRAVPVFKGSTNLHDVVKRCPNHMESSNDGIAPKDHFIRSNNPAARYHTCPESLRHSLVIPYSGPQVGTEYVTDMFAFMCFSSCASGPSRRPVEVIFTLEKEGHTLGRRVVEIRVCACPGRDRKSDEKAYGGEPSSSQGVKRTRKGSANKGPGPKRRRTTSRNESEREYTVTTTNRHVYDLLLKFRDDMEQKFEELAISSRDNSLVLSTSEDEAEQPSTSGTSTTLFKRVGSSSM